MTIRVVNVDPTAPRAGRLNLAVEALRDGQVLVIPTETFYGLAADPFHPGAIRSLNRLKKKPEGSPVLLLLSGMEQVPQVACDLPGSFHMLAETFWPGPLTLVVPAISDIPVDLSGGSGTVAIRVPGLALPRRLAAAFGRPITGASANLHGSTPCRTTAEVVQDFPEGLGLVLDGGTAAGGTPSTLLDLSVETPRVLREGAVPVSALEPFLAKFDPATDRRNV